MSKKRHQKKSGFLEKTLNFSAIFLAMLVLLFIKGGENAAVSHYYATKPSFSLSTQAYNEKLAYSKLLEEIKREKASAEIRYFPPPTVISITSPSGQFFFGASGITVFSPDDDLVIDGLSAPRSLVKIYFDPGELVFSGFSNEQGSFSLTLPRQTLSNGSYQLFVEGILDKVSTGRVKRLDIFVEKPMDRQTVFLFGSLVALLLAVVLGKFFLSGVKVEKD